MLHSPQFENYKQSQRIMKRTRFGFSDEKIEVKHFMHAWRITLEILQILPMNQTIYISYTFKSTVLRVHVYYTISIALLHICGEL